MTTRPAWLPDAALGALVAGFGLWEAFYEFGYGDHPFSRIVVALFIGVATSLYRMAPGFALLLVWTACSVQLVASTDVMYVELAAMIVSFGCARYGSAVVVWLSGLSIPFAALIGGGYVIAHSGALGNDLGEPVFRALGSYAYARPLVLGLVGLLILAVPWLTGIVFRVREQAARSREHERVALASKEQAEEIAGLREQQTRMAHDVHDVVGHSLAVILAQAESAQFLPDDDPDKMKATMANIATSARQSLRDVRHVLSASETAPAQDGGLDKLIEGVRAAGNEVQSTVVGTPRPLPPEIDAVAYRTLQEMLTNAIKHGLRGETVTVMRHWADELTIAVQNASTEAPGEGGLGLAGMRLRLESIGGRLDVRHDAGSFTATAWLPLRHGTLTR